MLKGINQWCFPEGTPLEKVFEYSRNAGFHAVELNVNNEDGVGLTVNTSFKEAKEIAKLASNYDLQLLSLSTGLLWETPLSDEKECVRKKGREVVEKQIELAAAMGIECVLVVPGVVNETVSYMDCYTRSQEELKKVIPIAEKYKVTLGIENVWNKFLLSPIEMVRFIDELDSEYIGAYFDIGNVLQFGYPEQWIRILGNRIKRVHIKDFNRSVGNITGFVPLLAGDVNWIEVYKALEEIGYKNTLTAEITPYAINPNSLAEDTSRHIDIILDNACKIYN